MSNRVTHFEVQADDLERAKAFYEKTFGWRIEKWMSKEKGGMDYWGLISGTENEPGINGGLYERPQNDPIRTFDCTIQVDDIDAAVAAVKANGGTIRQEKMEMKGLGWFARATDTEGNIFALMQMTEYKPELLV